MNRVWLALACCLSSSGCAIGTEHIDLAFSPVQAISNVPRAGEVSVAVRVIDSRTPRVWTHGSQKMMAAARQMPARKLRAVLS